MAVPSTGTWHGYPYIVTNIEVCIVLCYQLPIKHSMKTTSPWRSCPIAERLIYRRLMAVPSTGTWHGYPYIVTNIEVCIVLCYQLPIKHSMKTTSPWRSCPIAERLTYRRLMAVPSTGTWHGYPYIVTNIEVCIVLCYQLPIKHSMKTTSPWRSCPIAERLIYRRLMAVPSTGTWHGYPYIVTNIEVCIVLCYQLPIKHSMKTTSPWRSCPIAERLIYRRLMAVPSTGTWHGYPYIVTNIEVCIVLCYQLPIKHSMKTTSPWRSCPIAERLIYRRLMAVPSTGTWHGYPYIVTNIEVCIVLCYQLPIKHSMKTTSPWRSCPIAERLIYRRLMAVPSTGTWHGYPYIVTNIEVCIVLCYQLPIKHSMKTTSPWQWCPIAEWLIYRRLMAVPSTGTWHGYPYIVTNIEVCIVLCYQLPIKHSMKTTSPWQWCPIAEWLIYRRLMAVPSTGTWHGYPYIVTNIEDCIVLCYQLPIKHSMKTTSPWRSCPIAERLIYRRLMAVPSTGTWHGYPYIVTNIEVCIVLCYQLPIKHSMKTTSPWQWCPIAEWLIYRRLMAVPSTGTWHGYPYIVTNIEDCIVLCYQLPIKHSMKTTSPWRWCYLGYR